MNGQGKEPKQAVTDRAAAARSAKATADIYAEQVAMLYAAAPTAALANMANAAILTFLLWGMVPPRLLHGWLSAMVLVQLSRLGIAFLYRRAQPSPYGMKAARWDRWYLASVAAGGATWGTAGFWLFPQQAAELQLALIFVIAGTVAGATALLAPVLSAFPLFALPALVPLSIRFLMEDTPHNMAMAALTLIFLLVLWNVVRIIHAPIVSSIRLRMENSDLVAALTSRANNLQQINQLLGAQINEHVAVQEQFRDQFLFLQQLIDAIPNPVFYKDTKGVYQGCNEALTRFLGISKNNFIGKTVSDMVSRELAEEHARKDRELLERGGIQVYESPVKGADGTTRHILFHKTLFRDPLDKAIGIIGTLVDLTELKRAEQALRESNQLFEQLAENVHEVFYVSDAEMTKILYANPAYEKVWGRTRKSLYDDALSFLDAIHPDDREHVVAMVERQKQGLETEDEYRILGPDASVRWVRDRGYPVRNEKGQLHRVVGIAQDITEYKQKEGSLKLFRALVDWVPDCLEVIDPETGRFLDINEHAHLELGYTSNEMLSLTVPDIDPIVTQSAFDRLVVRLRAIPSLTFESLHLRKNGTSFPVEVNAKLVRSEREYLVTVVRDITERKREENALRESQERFSSAFGSAPIGMALVAPDGAWLKVNAALCNIVGYSEQELLKTTFQAITHPDDLDTEVPDFRKIVNGEIRSYHIDKRYFHKDGHVVWITKSVSMLTDNHGAPVYFIAQIQDITERRQAEAALAAARQQLQLAIESGRVGLWTWDIKTNTIFLSPSWKAQLGHADREIHNRFEECESRLHPEDRDRVLQDLMSLAQDPSSDYESEYRMRHKDGSYRWFLSRAKLNNNPEGQPTLITGCNIDITERRRLEDEIRNAEHKYRLLLNSAAEGIYGIDAEGRCTFINPAAAKMIGYAPAECIGQNMHALIHHSYPDGSSYPVEKCPIFDSIRTGKGYRTEDDLLWRRDGTNFSVTYAAFPLTLDGTIQGAVITFSDITERKKMEAQAGEVERLTTLGQLTDGIAHEMKNPLFILSGRLQLVKEKLAQREYEALPEDLQKIESAATRMTVIADHFSTLAKPLAPKPEPTSVQTILREVLGSLADKLREDRITVNAAISPDLPAIQADPSRLKTAFMNLIKNAMQAMAAAHGKGTLTVTAELKNGWVEVRVQDDGPGIAPEHRAGLFEPFFTAKTAGQGTGMGLWAVRSTVMTLRGTIACETETGKGATFIIRLPVADATAAATT